MTKTHFHVYYFHDRENDLVEIHAVWGAVGRGKFVPHLCGRFFSLKRVSYRLVRRSPLRVTTTSLFTAALDVRLLAADSAWRQ